MEELAEHDTALTVAVAAFAGWHRVPGGTGTSIQHLLEGLKDIGGLTVRALTPLSRHAGALPLPKEVRRVRMPLPVPYLYDFWHRTGMPRFDRRVPDADLIHVTNLLVPSPGALPWIATVHDVLPLTNPELFTSRGVAFMERGFERIAAAASRIVVPTMWVKTQVVAQGVAPERVQVIGWGATAQPVTPTDVARVRTHLGLRDVPTILTVGTLEPRKNLAALFAAVHTLDQPINLVVLGPQGFVLFNW